MKYNLKLGAAAIALVSIAGCQADAPAEQSYDLIIENAMIYDGLGGEPYAGEVAVSGDRIAYVGADAPGIANEVIDAEGQALAPGFINLLSWSNESLLYDGLGESSLRQGVTLEVMGEGTSMGPLTETMAQYLEAQQGSIQYDVSWRTLGGYFDVLEDQGIALNVASYVGAGSVRAYVLGFDDVDPSPEQMAEMQGVVQTAMEDGAMGVASSLIYPPGAYAETDELIALASQAAACGGIYATHLRSEGDRFLEGVEEALLIGQESGAPVEFFHLKVGGTRNFDKMPVALEMIEAAQAEGQAVTADMYVYPASGTTLTAMLPPWIQDGGVEAMLERLNDPDIRAEVIAEMGNPEPEWENLLLLAGGPENVMLAVVASEDSTDLVGMRISEIAELWDKSIEDTIIDLIIENNGQADAVYFTMSEENLRQIVTRPYVSFASDGLAMAPSGVFLEDWMHPRSYGNFARAFAHYSREEGLVSTEEMVRRMTSLPAGVLALADRGQISEGYAADLVVFDPETIQDQSTFLDPHQLSTGVDTVLVNGVVALSDGEPTGALPGQALRGRAYTGDGEGGCRSAYLDWE